MRQTLLALVLAVGCGGDGGHEVGTPGVPSTCTAIADIVGCDVDAISYQCSAGRPDNLGSDVVAGSNVPRLACSEGNATGEGSDMQYCCIVLDDTLAACSAALLAGCSDAAIALACIQGTSPGAVDTEIGCSTAQPGSDGSTPIYCCSVVSVPPECTTDMTLACGGLGIGYECSGGTTPADLDPGGTACDQGDTGSDGDTSYCCAPPPCS